MANFFTKQQIDDIRTALASDAKSDLEFPETTEITNNDYVAIVQNGLNKKIKADSFKGETGATGPQGPQGPQGIQGPEGQQGPQGDPGITSATVSVDNTSGTPTATATITNQNLNIAFTGLKGPQGEQGPAGHDGRDGSDADVTATNITNALGYTPASQDSDAVAGNVAEFDASGNPKDGGVAADNIAEQDGYYETMVVGGAENLIGSDIVASQFTRRKTGGSADVGTGVAILKTIKGNTLVWNQLIQMKAAGSYDSNSVAITIASDGKLTVSGTASANVAVTVTGNYTGISGHKYYIVCPTFASANFYVQFQGLSLHPTNGTGIYTCTTGSIGPCYVRVTSGNAASWSGYLKCIDLTQCFGAGNEPSTVAELKALYPLIDSLPYNTGSLLNFTGTGILTNGFNQWDEEWESGYYDSSGNKQNATNQICTKNLIPVFPGITYNNSKYNGASGILYYDADKQFINRVTAPGNPVTIPSGVYFVKINFGSTYGSTYNHDICINKSDANKNGTYEPYWTETKALPITTATSGGVAIFSDGMKSAGTAYDRYYKSAGSDLFDKAQEVIGSLNLGTLTGWTYNSANQYFYINANYIKLPADWATAANIKCATYYPVTGNAIANGSAANMSIAYAPNGTILIKNTAYTTSAQLEAALAGVTLYFESRTVTDYTLDTPFNGQYRVDNDGCELVIPENGSTPTTSPIVADINYALNAIDTIRNLPQNYISKASMDAILTAFKTAGVITNYTLTWDATNQKYNCTITA